MAQQQAAPSGGQVHYANGRLVKKVKVQGPPPPPATLSETNVQQGVTAKSAAPAAAPQAQGAVPAAPAPNAPPPNTLAAAHGAMDANAQAAHQHQQVAPPNKAAPPAQAAAPANQTQQAAPPAPPAAGKKPNPFAKKAAAPGQKPNPFAKRK